MWSSLHVCTSVFEVCSVCGPVVTCTHPCLCKCKARAPSPRKPACCQVAEGERERKERESRKRESKHATFLNKKSHDYKMLWFFFSASLRTVYAGNHQTGVLDCTDWLRGCRSTATIFLALELDLNYNVIKMIREICGLLCFYKCFLNCMFTRWAPLISVMMGKFYTL